MKLNEIIELNHKKSEIEPTISDIYGIIYRIYCIPEKKSYVGQTFSHIVSKYYNKFGLINRCKKHYTDRKLDRCMIRPFYQALNTYESNQFEVYEEKRIYGKELARINQIEGEYMEKYNSVYPNGYNLEEVGKRYGSLLQRLSEYHKFEIQKFQYKDKTRKTRCKDVCFGKRFGLKRQLYSQDLIIEKLSEIEIDSIRLMDSNGLRMIIKEKDCRDNIRIYFSSTKEDCIKFAEELCDNIEIAESFKKGYKCQNKLDKVINIDEDIHKVIGKLYSKVYHLNFYGRKNNRIQSLADISFGGKNLNEKDSIDKALEFVELYMKQTNNEDTEYILQSEI